MLNKDDVINTIEAKKDEIKSLGIIKLSIFGSLVRNELDENSDID
ncbi:MAG: nucleotidyltransferase domain-containing protein, partial [Candidatus Delongbacteria bacterium]|nr:nucleotidyltransferase domain-containing protein [Candidatus Delongbacteria bacterium]